MLIDVVTSVLKIVSLRILVFAFSDFFCCIVAIKALTKFDIEFQHYKGNRKELILMMLFSFVISVALMASNVVLVDGTGVCSCPIVPTDEGLTAPGKCADSDGNILNHYSTRLVSNYLRCREACEEDDDCKGSDFFFEEDRVSFNNNGDNCYFYDSIPMSINTSSNSDSADNYYCSRKSSLSSDFSPVTKDRIYYNPTLVPGDYGNNHGKCRNTQDGGLMYDSVFADNEADCEQKCQDEGADCEGFDYRVNYSGTNCKFNSNIPTYIRPETHRTDYTLSWRCYARGCNCDTNQVDPPPQPLCDNLMDLIVGDEVCINTNEVCEATADLKANSKESCNEWCGRVGLSCDKAWNDGSNDCQKKKEISCSTSGNKYSICRCIQ